MSPAPAAKPPGFAQGERSSPLTLGTAGHIDHGKTALVRALTGVDTDRLPEERSRGMTIDLGFAPLRLPSGRRLSVVDVPGHERFVRTMVAGASGIDAYLMVVAADDGVMPQTREHAAVLAGLGVTDGVVAVTKADMADPEVALLEAGELLPGARAVAVSARDGTGLDELRAALDGVAARLAPRSGGDGPTRLHVDRAFSIRGAGTVVTGTLWAGSIGRGDTLALLPRGEHVRVRGVQVHDEPAERAEAGQRVAVNLVGVEVRDVARGDVLAAVDAALAPSYVVDVAVDAGVDPEGRVHVHHGTRESPARVAALGGRFHQLRLERPLVAVAGDRVVLRSVAPPDTLGGGVVLDPHARKHGANADVVARLEALERGESAAVLPDARQTSTLQDSAAGPAASPPPLSAGAFALEQTLLAAGREPPTEAELGDRAAHLAELRRAGRAVRVGRTLHYHPDALAEIRATVVRVIEDEGAITLARLRDELGTTRKFAQALLEHLDGEHVTVRRPDDTRVLRRRTSGASAASPATDRST